MLERNERFVKGERRNTPTAWGVVGVYRAQVNGFAGWFVLGVEVDDGELVAEGGGRGADARRGHGVGRPAGGGLAGGGAGGGGGQRGAGAQGLVPGKQADRPAAGSAARGLPGATARGYRVRCSGFWHGDRGLEVEVQAGVLRRRAAGAGS